jgi:hypothetical protein
VNLGVTQVNLGYVARRLFRMKIGNKLLLLRFELTTLRGFLEKVESSYGKARRVWVMDRGIPTEEVLEEMRTSDRGIFYLVGTPRSKVRQYEKKWLDLPWQKVRESVEVKLFAEAGELYVLAKSEGRRAKERAMPCGGKN